MSANINLTKTNEVVNSINNGTITGTFNKYSWGVNGLDFEQDSLVFSVYANQNFEYYPQIDLILEYSGTGYENVHLSFNTNQNKIFSIVDSLGEYYSYLVQTLDYNIIVTYPRLSQIQDVKVQKYIKCFIIGNDNRPLKFTGTNFDELNFRLRLNDLITGIYCDSSYIEDVSLKINFDINQNLEL